VANGMFVYLQIMQETSFVGYINGHEYASRAKLPDFIAQIKTD
jgi:hypothetical protein